MCEPDTHQAILQAVAELEVIAKGSEKEGGEEKEREGEHPFGTKDVSFSNAFRGEKSFSKCQVCLLELSSNILQICRCAEVTGVLRCHWTPHPWKRRTSSSSSAALPTKHLTMRNFDPYPTFICTNTWCGKRLHFSLIWIIFLPADQSILHEKCALTSSFQLIPPFRCLNEKLLSVIGCCPPSQRVLVNTWDLFPSIILSNSNVLLAQQQKWYL